MATEAQLEAALEATQGDVHAAAAMIRAAGKYSIAERQKMERIRREMNRLQIELKGIEKTAAEREEREQRIVRQQQRPVQVDLTGDDQSQSAPVVEEPTGIQGSWFSSFSDREKAWIGDKRGFDYLRDMIKDFAADGVTVYETVPFRGYWRTWQKSDTGYMRVQKLDTMRQSFGGWGELRAPHFNLSRLWPIIVLREDKTAEVYSPSARVSEEVTFVEWDGKVKLLPWTGENY